MQGLYFQSALISVLSCLGKDKKKYIEKPYLSEAIAKEKDPEANERLAVAEMECWIALLNKQGNLPETITADLDKETET